MVNKSEGATCGCLVLVVVAIAFVLTNSRGNPPKQQQIDALKAEVLSLKREVRDLRAAVKSVTDTEMPQSSSLETKKSE